MALSAGRVAFTAFHIVLVCVGRDVALTSLLDDVFLAPEIRVETIFSRGRHIAVAVVAGSRRARVPHHPRMNVFYGTPIRRTAGVAGRAVEQSVY